MSWKFWKKDDIGSSDFKTDFKNMDLGLPKENGTGLDFSNTFQAPSMPSAPGMPPMPQPNMGQQYPPPQSAFPSQNNFSSPNGFPPPSYPPPQSMTPIGEDTSSNTNVQKDLEVIAAKLDTIRAQLDMLNARLANLERTGEGPKRPWY